jgi:hypothetical protein
VNGSAGRSFTAANSSEVVLAPERSVTRTNGTSDSPHPCGAPGRLFDTKKSAAERVEHGGTTKVGGGAVELQG